MKFYKIISEDNKSCNGGSFDWTEYLPVKNEDGSWTPGKWTPEQPVVMYESGYHVMDAYHLLNWPNTQLYECEVIGAEADKDNEKYACNSIRLTRKIETWNDKTLRLFACWCARKVWPILDERSKNAIEVAERFANGEATQEELRAAAKAAAWAAARDAVRATAWEAARAAAWDAAWGAAWDAAMAAAWDAARAADWDAARGAAWDAARAAAWDAAWDAAREAARNAARDAARNAARNAARDSQYRHLLEMLEIESED